MNGLRCPQCRSSRVSSMNEHLTCFGCGRSEYLYDYRNAHDLPVAVTEDPEVAELRERIDNLEALSAQRGSIPRRFHSEVQQLRGQVKFLHRKVVEHRKVTEQPPTTSAPSKYQDIKV